VRPNTIRQIWQRGEAVVNDYGERANDEIVVMPMIETIS
jgi:hypothetical protein